MRLTPSGIDSASSNVSHTRRWPLLTVVLVTLLAAVTTFTHAGQWLVVADPVRPASAIAVFGGGFPSRAMGAARLYNEGWAPRVWLTQAAAIEEEALSEVAAEPIREEEGSRRLLQQMGVPQEAIQVIAGRPQNTVEEVRLIGDALRAAGGSTVILMTSKNHTRRVRAIWHAQFDNTACGIVRYTPDDQFQPDHWWRNSADFKAVAHEWFGLLGVWTRLQTSSR
jgi:uncharacterized SAM-binding protein YcdF (DUF218 family)